VPSHYTLVGVVADGSPIIAVGEQPQAFDNGSDYQGDLAIKHADGSPYNLVGKTVLLSLRDLKPERNLVLAREAIPDDPANGLCHIDGPLAIDALKAQAITLDVVIVDDVTEDRELAVPAYGDPPRGEFCVIEFGSGQPTDPVTVPPSQAPLAMGPPGLGWGQAATAPAGLVVSSGAGAFAITLGPLPDGRVSRVRIYAEAIDPVTGDALGMEWKGTLKSIGGQLAVPGSGSLQEDGTEDRDAGAGTWSFVLTSSGLSVVVTCTVDRAGVRFSASMLLTRGALA
jgi:hypothetical protein